MKTNTLVVYSDWYQKEGNFIDNNIYKVIGKPAVLSAGTVLIKPINKNTMPVRASVKTLTIV